jgi:hypothetical protein
VRRRDPRRLIERERRTRARVNIIRVPNPGCEPDGSISTKQQAEVTLPRSELDRIWTPEYMERLARTYWRFLTHISLGLLKVLYTPTSREVVFIARPFVLLRFRAPEYGFEGDSGTVTWPIDRGLLVARRSGRSRGYLRLTVTRQPDSEDGGAEATVTVTSEVVSFYPMIAARIGRWIYNQTQLRIHVIVTHAFLRSLANLDFEESRVGVFSPSALRGSPAAYPDRGER